MISLRHYQIFQAVAETGSFTKAAQRLYITQSAVSHAVRELEEYAGYVLFDRLSKSVRPTAAGRVLLEESAPLLKSFEALDKRLGRLEEPAPVHIVSSITIAAFYLPRILREFHERRPELPVHVKVVPAAEAVNILRLGEADIALIEGAAPQGPFCCRRFARYTLRIAAAPGYPVPRKLRLDEFCGERLLLREPGSAIRDTLDSGLFLLGRSVRPVWESVNSTALVEAAKSGLGITVLPEILIKEELSRNTLTVLKVEGLSLENDLLAVWHKDKHMTTALKELTECIRAPR